MKELTSIGLAVAFALVFGVIGYAVVAPRGDAWSDDLAARQAAFREAEAQRRAEAEAAAEEEARRQAVAQAQAAAEAEAEAAAQAEAEQAEAEQAASAAPAGGTGYNPLAPRSGSGGGYSPLAGTGGGQAAGTTGYDPLAPKATPEAARAETASMHPEFGMPDTEGVDIVYYSCTACHSAALFTAQRLTPQRWDEVLTWMVETQNMAEPHPEDREVILDYLVRHFSTESTS